MKIKPDLANFERCQRFLQLCKQQKGNISNQQIHKFIGRFDRNSIRNAANFKPLQQMMKQLVPKLIIDKFICSNSHMMSNLASIFGSLNLYSKEFMEHTSHNMENIVKQNKQVNIQQINNVYRAFVQLHQHNYQPFINILRQHLKNTILKQFKVIILEKQYLDHSFFLKKLQSFHRYIRTLLLDPHLHPQFLAQIFQEFQIIFIIIGKQPLKTQQNFTYHNCAVVYQYIKVLKIQIEEGIYYNFIKSIYERRKKDRQQIRVQNSSQQQFERTGESVFENRFQKNLHLSGYWFESNIKIGLNQYDVLVKGMRRQQFIPFQNIDLDKLKQGQFTPIGSQQRKTYENMKGLWFIDQKKKLKQDLVINLNGPYHYISGDKQGLVRSQVIKQTVLEYYGYSSYKSIDYRVWQRQTNNQRAIKNFFKQLIIF